IGLDPPVEVRRRRISDRLVTRLNEGMVEEVEGLLDQGVSPAKLDYYGLEYKWINQYIQGRIGFEQMRDKLEVEIHRFAKRQMTWFRRMERHGNSIHWLEEPDTERALSIIRANAPGSHKPE
ncbi:MAG: tRNA (adenosine(37)-N6)-dimethylallyltransferase MiaA, partial [Flavobacteriales bacterium]|nr:tRNA (adenosine(37)-N6)-dimethylallyltransferase MiaA [Flavobacteriales bacterium]